MAKTSVNKGYFIFKWGYALRKWCYNKLKLNGVVDEQLKVASALLLGYREKLDNTIVQAYASAGAMHVLAVSDYILEYYFSY